MAWSRALLAACFGGAKPLFEFGPSLLDGIQIGRVGGRYSTSAAACWISPLGTPLTLCELRLSITPTSPGRSAGHSTCSM